MYSDATQVGIMIVVLTVGGMLAGKFIDARLNTAPIGILSGIVIGVVLASIFLFFKFRSIIKKEEITYTEGTNQKKGGASMEKCQKCGHEHEGECTCGCTIAKCDECGHMHGDDACSCGCGK
jgi:hypothetical protein